MTSETKSMLKPADTQNLHPTNFKQYNQIFVSPKNAIKISGGVLLILLAIVFGVFAYLLYAVPDDAPVDSGFIFILGIFSILAAPAGIYLLLEFLVPIDILKTLLGFGLAIFGIFISLFIMFIFYGFYLLLTEGPF
ncbi:MAG: hypothetical protein ACXAD7_19840 [Candidatus Kariarchaeaceae archaeon]|jgi:hypothetical protein